MFDFVSVEEVYQSDGNLSGNQTLHRCGILDQEVGSLSLVDDDLQLSLIHISEPTRPY